MCFSNAAFTQLKGFIPGAVVEYMRKPLSCVFLEQDQITEDETCLGLLAPGQLFDQARWN